MGILDYPGGYEVVEFWIGGGFDTEFRLTGEFRFALPIGWIKPI